MFFLHETVLLFYGSFPEELSEILMKTVQPEKKTRPKPELITTGLKTWSSGYLLNMSKHEMLIDKKSCFN